MHFFYDRASSIQLYTPLRVGGVPWVPEWVVEGVQDLPLHLQEPRLLLVAGRVLSVSMPSTFTLVQPSCGKFTSNLWILSISRVGYILLTV